MAIAMIDVQPTPSEIEIAEANPNSFLTCLAMDKRAFGFIANSGNDSVARIDLCTGLVESTKSKGNPFVVSHIPVGKFPVDVAVSLDQAASRIFVANGGESSLTIIVSQEGRTLQDKVALSGHPSRVVVAPSQTVPEGDVYVTLSEIGRVVRVVKQSSGDRELWVEDKMAVLSSTETPDPLPGGMAVDPKGRWLYITDMGADFFHIVDLSAPEYPARSRKVLGPQRDCAISPDGRFLYLARLDQRKIAVYDLVEDRYIDTNDELPSHFNQPPPGAGVDYDIGLQAIPRTVVFANVAKTIVEPVVDGDTDTTDGDSDAEFEADDDIESDFELDGDSEADLDSDTESDAEESELSENDSSARLFADCADGDVDCDSDDEQEMETEEVDLPAALYAYSIGINGNIQVLDVHGNLHELFDTNPYSLPSLGLISRDEFEVDNGMCIADVDVRLELGRAPEARWELRYNAIIPESDGSVSGRFEDGGLFVDPNVDFSMFDELLTAAMIPDPAAPGAARPDWLEITSVPYASVGDRIGCVEEITTDDGETVLQELQSVKLEILDAGSDFLMVDTRGIDIGRCFDTAVAYQIRTQENYLVYMTSLDSQGSRLDAPVYKGRAVNTPFRKGQVVKGEEQLESLVFDNEDWEQFVCTFDTTSPTGDAAYEYIFRNDMALDNGDVVRGIRCLNRETDGEDYWVSFENDEILFSICQDDSKPDIQAKQGGTFIYSFQTTSGINEILLEIEDGEFIDRFVGSNPENAVVMNSYPQYPRLYVVDSSEEIVYVIDLTTDTVIYTIQ
jgi:DNA-binding beta-propeller fold protein YncE